MQCKRVIPISTKRTMIELQIKQINAKRKFQDTDTSVGGWIRELPRSRTIALSQVRRDIVSPTGKGKRVAALRFASTMGKEVLWAAPSTPQLRSMAMQKLLDRFEHLLDSMGKVPPVDNDPDSVPSQQAITIAIEILRTLYRDFKRLPNKVGAFVDGLIGLQYGNDRKFIRFEVYNDGEIVLLKRTGEKLTARELSQIELPALYTTLFDSHG